MYSQHFYNFRRLHSFDQYIVLLHLLGCNLHIIWSSITGGKYLHGSGFAGPVVSEEGGDLALVEVEAEVLHCNLSVGVDFVKVIDGDACHI